MNYAFEITPDDVGSVLAAHGIDTNDNQSESWFHTVVYPEADRIEKAALGAECNQDMEKTLQNQTEAAHAEIALILKEHGVIPS